MDESAEIEIVTTSVDHPLVGKTVTFRIFAEGDVKTGTVSDAVRDVDGTVYLIVSVDGDEYRIMQQNIVGVTFDDVVVENGAEG